jgi:hypothetical protein
MKTILLISSLFLVSVIGLSQSTEKKGAVIVVDKEVHDFGSVVFGSSASCEFVITNTGVKPLIITSCKGSCGCTIPSCSELPILPNGTYTMTVKYDTKREGQINKSVIHDDLIEEWIGDDDQEACDCAACKQQSSSVQPATSKKCSNVGKGPQQPSIAEDNARMLEEVADPSPPGNNITNGVVLVQSSSSSTVVIVLGNLFFLA